MPSFDFIVQAEFRAALESDYTELLACLKVGAWKSTQVIAGSIVESILIDYFVATTNPSRAQKDPLRLDLAEAISTAKLEGVLTERTADLSSVIRSYRNLIHPGRVKRLSEPAPSESSAVIAKSVVDLIIEEIAKVRLSTFGLTADQIVAKIEFDESSLGLLKLLLKDVHAGEMRRLLMEVLPKRYLLLRDRVADESDDDALVRFAAAFRVAHGLVDEPTKKLLAAKFVGIVREDSGDAVSIYRDAFFRPSDLEFVEERHRPLIKQQYLTTSPTVHSPDTAAIYADLASFLEAADVARWVDPYVRALVSTANSENQRTRVESEFVAAVVSGTNQQIDERVQKRLDTWIENFAAHDQPEKIEIIRALKPSLRPEVEDFPSSP